MQITPYLNFDGNCREAFEFYANVFGGKPDIMSFADSPVRNEIPAEARNRVMHAHLAVGSATLMASDIMPGMCIAQPGTCNVALMIDDVEKAEKAFSMLAEGGEVRMPFEKTFWVERFGMLVDRFGISWLINGGKARTTDEIAADEGAAT